MTLQEFYETTPKDIFIMGKYLPIRYSGLYGSEYDNRHVKQVTTVGNVEYVELWEKIEKR